MKMRFGLSLVIFVFLALTFFGSPGSRTSQSSQVGAIDHEPNALLIKFKPMVTELAIARVFDSIQATLVSYRGETIPIGSWAENKCDYRSFLGDPYLFYIKLPPNLGIEEAISELEAYDGVEFAEKNYLCHIDALPNDPSFSQQWGLNNTTQTGGTADADIDAPEAWEDLTDSSDVIIAVIDTGVDYNHIDLQTNIWTNPGESGGGKETDGIDNDGNGFIDDWHGWDFYNSDNDPLDDNYDGHHGTHVAGIIGARGNSGEGISGVCWNAKLMPLKTLGYFGTGYPSMTVSAIDYAVDMGARIINLSYGHSGGYSSAEYQAIERAMASGVLVVASAGNTTVNTNVYPHYPSSYDIDNIISVLSTDQWDALSSFSNYGPYTVDLGAPGGTNNTQGTYNILTTNSGDTYDYFFGTSAAVPFISGGAALLLQQRPTISWWQAKAIILKSGDQKSALNGKARTNVRFSLVNALNYATPNLPMAPSELAYSVVEDNGLYDIVLTWTDNSNNESGFKIYMQTSPNVFALVGSTGPNTTTFTLDEVGAGIYYFYAYAYRTEGDSTKTANLTVHVN